MSYLGKRAKTRTQREKCNTKKVNMVGKKIQQMMLLCLMMPHNSLCLMKILNMKFWSKEIVPKVFCHGTADCSERIIFIKKCTCNTNKVP